MQLAREVKVIIECNHPLLWIRWQKVSCLNRGAPILHVQRHIVLLGILFADLEPLLARVVDLFQNASSFRLAVPSRRARRTSSPCLGIAKDTVVLDVELVLVVIPVKVVSTGFAVVANVLIVVAFWETVKVALRKNGNILRGVGRIVACVLFGIKEIKGSLVLEGSVECGVFL